LGTEITPQDSLYHEVYSCLDPEDLLERTKHNICEEKCDLQKMTSGLHSPAEWGIS